MGMFLSFSVVVLKWCADTKIRQIHSNIYNALINALSTHWIYINLKAIFYIHVKNSPTDTVYILYIAENKLRKKSSKQNECKPFNDLCTHYTDLHTHTHMHMHNCSYNWILILFIS